MDNMKRFVSMLLCFVMLLGFLPAGAAVADAAETPLDAAVIFSDLHIGTNSSQNSSKQTLVENVLTAIKNDYPNVSTVNSAGDMFSSNESTISGDASTVTGWVQSVFDVPVNYVWSDHDRAATDISKESRLVYGAGADNTYGTSDDGNYYIYLLSMADLSSWDRYSAGFYSESQISQHIEAFKTAVAGLNEDTPLFIVGHQPLFDNRGDNGHAYKWVMAINEIAADRDVTYFFGHNHKYDVISGTPNDYYYPVGSTMSVPTTTVLSGTGYNTDLDDVDVKLEFTHVCAGYMNPETTGSYSSSTSRLGTAVAAVIYDDHIDYVAYDKDGIYDSNASMALNVSVDRKNAASSGGSSTGGSSSGGSIGLLGDYVEITPAVSDDVTTYENGWITFEEYVPEVGGTAAGTKIKYVLDTDGVDAGTNYLILNTKANGTGYALKHEVSGSSHTYGSYEVTIEDSVILIDDGTTVNWVFGDKDTTATWGGWRDTYSISNQSRYLYPNSGSLSMSSSRENLITVNADGGAYRLSRQDNVGTRFTWVNYRNGAWTGTQGSSSAITAVYLFAEDGTVEIPGTPGTPAVPGLYGCMEGELSYEVAPGTSAAEAVQDVMDGITVKYATLPDYSDVQICADDAEGLTWTLDPSYDGTAGDYAVTIAYNGVTLGVAEVVVPAVSAYYGAEGSSEYTVEMGATAAEALAAVKQGVTVYKAADANGTDKQEIDDSLVTWKWVDTFNGSAPGPYTVEIYYGGELLGSTEVKVNVSYGEEKEESDPVEIGGCTTVTKTKTVYVYQSGNPSGEVLIVTRNSAGSGNMIANTGNSAPGNYSVTVNNGDWDNDGDSELYIELTDTQATQAVWTVGGSYTFRNQGSYLRYSSGLKLGSSSTTWKYNSNNKLYYDSSTDRYLRYNNGWTTTSRSSYATSVYFYVPQSVTYEEEVCSIIKYTLRAEDLSHNLTANSMTAKLDYCLQGNGTDLAEADLPAGGSYGFAVVDDNNTVIEAIDQQTGEITFTGVSGTTMVRVSYSWTDSNGESHTVYNYVTVTAKAPNNYPEYPDEGAVQVGKSGTGINFQSSGIAQVELTASGIPMKRGVDIIVMLDMSSSMNRHSDCGETSCSDSSCSKVTRLTELKQALVTMQDLLQNSGNQDMMRIAIADFNGFFGSSANESGTPYDRDSADNMGGNLPTNGSSYRTGVVYNAVTGDTCEIGADAFVDVSDMDITAVNAALDSQKATRGTNYDHGFDVIYQLGHAIRTENERKGEEDRELVVIFMSDGAPNQYNYYHSIGGSGDAAANADENYKWNKWLQGTFAADQLTSGNIGCATHSYYYDNEDHDGDGVYNEHRMATAIKGNRNEYYKVIRKNQDGTGKDAVTEVLQPTGQDNLYLAPGLGATMYAVGFHIRNDGDITEKSVQHVLNQIPSSPEMYIQADNSEALASAFNNITTDILYAANNARFVDKMGKDYDLQMAPLTDIHGNPLDMEDPQSKIEVLEYEIWTRSEWLSGKCSEEQVGDRKLDANGNPIVKVIETVRFSYTEEKDESGEVTGYTITGAYSNLIDKDKDGISGWTEVKDSTGKVTGYTFDPDDTILADGTDANYAKGVIYARNFLYNTSTANDVPIPEIKDAEGNTTFSISIPTGTDDHNLTTGGTNILPAESFYWGMGTVKTSQLALRYYVYLTGSKEGTREAGSYPTNEYAKLYYDNYVGNHCHKDTVSPVLAWKEANVSYAFYLVDESGNVIVNQTTGQTGSFANKIAVTNPVVHQTVKLNSSGEVNAAIVSQEVLPDGYTLFDAAYNADGTIAKGAAYAVEINSDSTGSWDITSVKTKDTTYVMQYNPGNSAAYSNVKHVEDSGNDYTHTVVWFAVVWKIQALPDTVVVDYGLPVDISVLANDMFGAYGKLAAVGPVDNANLDTHDLTLADGFGKEYKGGSYGDAQVYNEAAGKVRYSLRKGDGMSMNSYERFAYAVDYSGSTNAGYYYDTVTVIPATTIYYEDNFLTYSSYTWENNGWVELEESESLWEPVRDESTYNPNAVQGEDRPGRYSMTDANNIYGFDGVNKDMSMYSLGSAMKATVDYDNYAAATFTFCGTGFDVISMTNSATGTLAVSVFATEDMTIGEKTYKAGATVKSFIVDTYYGYRAEYDSVTYTFTDGQWVETDRVALEEKGEYVSAPANPAEGATYTTCETRWIVDPTVTDSIYQVPVIEVEDLPYNTYDVEIQALYEPIFDNVDGSTSYEIYLDAIRVYDPANNGANNSVIEDAYKADGEGWPSYIELRDGLIDADSFDRIANEALPEDLKMEGLVFIDGDAAVGSAQISDYTNFGPNNEIYLAPGQRVAFLLRTPENIANVHIGLSLAMGTEASYTITNVALMDSEDGSVETGTYYNYKSYVLDTATDMYYDLTAWKNDIIVISNTSNKFESTQDMDGVISITNIKSTYTSNPEEETEVILPEGTAPAALAAEQSVGTYSLKTMSAEPAVAAEAAETPVDAEETVDSRYTYVYFTAAAAEAVVGALNSGVDPSIPAVPVNPAPPVAPEEPELPEEPTVPEVFEPALFDVMLSKTQIKVDQKVLVIVTTSADVDYVTINGRKVTDFSVGSRGNRTWKLNVIGEKAGVMDVAVVCWNAEDAASETVTKHVTVRHKNALGLIADLFD